METVVHELASRFSKNHAVSVISGAKTKTNNSFTNISIPSQIPSQSRNPNSILAKLFLDSHALAIAVFSLRSLIKVKDINPDLIIVCNGGWQALLYKIFCIFFRKKLIISGQAGLGWDDRWNLLHRPNAFIALSKRNADWAKSHAKGVRIEIIPNGVDTVKFQPQGIKSEINLEKPIAICVAGPESYKNVTKTIDAVAMHKDLSLLLVRSSLAEDKDVIYSKKKLGKRFLHKSFSYGEMPSVYRACNLFTLVSEPSEAFGISYLEAMACNLPVVAPDDELRREIIADAGIYVKTPIDIENYAQTLDRALKTSWLDKPRERALGFDWDYIALKYEELFRDLLE